jgi:enoyl-CoA hydratase/carnithine racemase
MSSAITLEHAENISTITINQPPFNLLDIDTIDALVEAHRLADARPDTGVIVTRSALEGMFSNGLNPLFVLERDVAGRVEVFRAVGRLALGLYELTKPHIAVINGPAMAGGAILAILADFRYFEAERGRICFAESKVGLPIPGAMQQVIADVCVRPWLREVILLGKNLDARQARSAGLADDVAHAQELDQLVAKHAARISRLSLEVNRANKRALRAGTVAALRELVESDAAASELGRFVGDGFLGEGLKAFLEGRRPVFEQ